MKGELARLLASYGYFAVFGVVALESFGIPLPGETMLITAAIYAGATHRLSATLVVAAAAAAAIVGDNLGYAAGRWGGFALIRRYGKYVRLNEPRLKLGRYIFLRHGGKVVFFGRFVSLLRTYAAFLAGTNRMPWPRFVVFNALGGICWAAIFGYGAYWLGARVERASKPVDIVIGVVAAAVLLTALVFVRRNERRLTAQAERALPGPLEP